jgi:hypothetical protein
LFDEKRIPIRVDPDAPEGAFIKALTDLKVEVVEVPAREYRQACGTFLASVVNGELRHIRQESLSRSVSVADRRDVGHEGGWAWTASTDISPLKAATLALSGVEVNKAAPVFAY